MISNSIVVLNYNSMVVFRTFLTVIKTILTKANFVMQDTYMELLCQEHFSLDLEL